MIDYTGDWDLCTWGQDEKPGGYREIVDGDKVTPYHIGDDGKPAPGKEGGKGGPDSGSGKPNPNSSLTEKNTKPSGNAAGQFTKYDAPGRDFIPDGQGTGVHETYLGWARGSDGSYDEDTITIDTRMDKSSGK